MPQKLYIKKYIKNPRTFKNGQKKFKNLEKPQKITFCSKNLKKEKKNCAGKKFFPLSF